MEIKTNKETMLDALSAASFGLTSSSINQSGNKLLFNSEPKSSNIVIIGYGDEVEITSKCPCEGVFQEKVAFTAEAQKMLGIVGSLPENAKVTLVFDTSKNGVVLKSGKGVYKLNGTDPKAYPRMREKKEPSVWERRLNSNQFIRLLEKTSYAASSVNGVRDKIMQGIALNLGSSSITSESMDGFRYATWTESLGKTNNEAELSAQLSGVAKKVMSQKTANICAKLLRKKSGQDFGLMVYDDKIVIQGKDFSFTSLLLVGEFPNLPPVDFKDMTGAKFSPTELLSSLKRVLNLCEDKDSGIKLELSKSHLKITTSDTQTSADERAEEIVNVSFDGDSVESQYNIRYLLNSVGVMEEGRAVELFIPESGGEIMFFEKGSESTEDKLELFGEGYARLMPLGY